MKDARIRALLIPILAAVIVLPGGKAAAQSDGDDEIQQTVARVSYLAGDVSYSRGDDPDNWQAAAVNVVFSLGDRLYTPAGGRAELEIHGGSAIDLAEGADLSALNLSDAVKQFSLNSGTASFRIRQMHEGESFEVDTPNVAASFTRAGLYRVDIDQDGNTTIDVRRGEASVAAGGGQVDVEGGQRIRIVGTDEPQYDVGGLPPPDGWDTWVEGRQAQFRRLRSYQYVNSEVAGLNDLDAYGQWEDVPEYGHVWAPAHVDYGWQPYRAGSWVWQDPWGWTWVSTEPWGWAPYHYGRWVASSSRWFWVPGPRDVRVRYSPALVGFVGGGPGWHGSVSASGGYVGWFPLAPADPFVPWWGRHREVNVTNVTYVNRNYVTIVNNTTFVSGAGVDRAIVRDPGVVRQIVAAPVIRGPLPVMPTQESLRVTQRQAGRPPAPGIVTRPVVTKLAPPPAPPLFRAKLDSIRQGGGAPVTSVAASRLATESESGARAAVPIRPAASRSGNIALTPGSGGASAPQPQQIRSSTNRALSTWERPMVASPGATATGNSQVPAHLAPGAVARPPNPPKPNVGTELGHDAPMPRNAPESQDRRQYRPVPPPAPPTQHQAPPPPERHAAPPPPPRPQEQHVAPPPEHHEPPSPPPPEHHAAPPPEHHAAPPPEHHAAPPPERHAAPPPERPPADVAPPARGAPPQAQHAPAPAPKPVPKPEKPKPKPEEKKDKDKDKNN